MNTFYNSGHKIPMQQGLNMQNIYQQQYQAAIQQGGNSFSPLLGLGGVSMGVQGELSGHLGMVKTFRKKFKEYTKEEFRHISNKPVIKNILIGMTVLNKEQIADRVKEHLDNV